MPIWASISEVGGAPGLRRCFGLKKSLSLMVILPIAMYSLMAAFAAALSPFLAAVRAFFEAAFSAACSSLKAALPVRG